MMKILMVTSSMDIGGAETHIAELCFALKKRGISVSVASAGGACVALLEQRMIPHITLPLDRKTPLALLTSEKGLSELIRKEKFDIVHAHARIPAFLCGRLRKRLGFRFVTTDHARFSLTPLHKRLTDWGELTFAVSEDLREYLIRHFRLDPSRIALTVNGIDTERFSPTACDPSVRARFHAENRVAVLHISRLEKDLCLCVHALMGAVERLSGSVTLWIAGDGDYADVLRKEADALNVRLGYEAAVLLGGVTDVERYIAAADIVASPSRAAMEAMACAKPTVVCGSQGYGGIFRGQIAAEAVKSNFCFRGAPLPTAETLAGDLRTLLDMDEKERAALGAFARHFISENYSVSVMTNAYLDGYRTLPETKKHIYDILICGYYGYGNAGDETLLSVIVCELRKRCPSIRLCALSADPEKTKTALSVDAVARFDLDRIAKAMARSKMLLFGGGNLLQDKTSTHSLYYYIHVLRMAKRRNLKILVYANGIGPLCGKGNLSHAKSALMQADEISLRDPDSFALVQSLSCEKPVRLTFDPAILTEKRDFPVPHGNYFVVVPKSSSPFFTEALVRVTRELAQKTGMIPAVVALYEREDAVLAQTLAARTGAQLLRPKIAGEYITLFSSASLVVSSRLHGLVYATAAACPMIGYADDPKIFSYLSYIGFGEGAHLDCGVSTNVSPETAIARAEKILGEERYCREKLSDKLPEWKALAKKEIGEAIRLLDSD